MNTQRFRRGSGDGMCERGIVCNTGSPSGWLDGAELANGCAERRGTGPLRVADRVAVPQKPGNAGGGKDPWSGNSAGRGEREVIDE